MTSVVPKIVKVVKMGCFRGTRTFSPQAYMQCNAFPFIGLNRPLLNGCAYSTRRKKEKNGFKSRKSKKEKKFIEGERVIADTVGLQVASNFFNLAIFSG